MADRETKERKLVTLMVNDLGTDSEPEMVRVEEEVRAISDEIERKLREERGFKAARREGERESRWIVLDFVDFVVHVFLEEERAYYDLERLWRDAPVVARSDEVGSLVTA